MSKKNEDVKMGEPAVVSEAGKQQADWNTAPMKSAEIPAGAGVAVQDNPEHMEKLKAEAHVIENPKAMLGDIPSGGPKNPLPDLDKLKEGEIEPHYQQGNPSQEFPSEEAPKEVDPGKPTKVVNHARVPAPLKDRKKDTVEEIVGHKWLAKWLQSNAAGREDYADFTVWMINPCLVDPKLNGDGCCRVEKHQGGDAVWMCHHSGAVRLLRSEMDLPNRAK